MTKFRALLLSASLVAAGMIIPAATTPQVACAATADSAALVVDTGASVTRYCVEIPRGGTDGIGLIKLAAQQYGLTYNLGFGGAAVCALNGVGVTSSSDCFAEMPNFWGYYIGSSSGGWSWSGTGAGSISVDPGDVQGWAWGTGKDGSSHPQPPATRYEDVCSVQGGGGGSADEPKNGGSKVDRNDRDRAPAADTTNTNTSGATDDRPREALTDSDAKAKDGEPRSSRSGASTAGPDTDPTADSLPILNASPIAMAAGSATPTTDPPIGGIVVLALVVALIVAGAFVAKRPHGRHARR